MKCLSILPPGGENPISPRPRHDSPGEAISKIYEAGLQPLVSDGGCNPGALPRAAMRTRFQRSLHRSECRSRGRSPASCQPGAKPQVCTRTREPGAEGPPHAGPGAEGPLHASLGRSPGFARVRRNQGPKARLMPVQGPKARFMPAWGEAPGLHAYAGTKGCRPAS